MDNVVKLDEKRCSICEGYIEPLRDPKTGEVVWEGGHNAQPINDGRCCDECNANVVIRARLMQLYANEK
tara:strand:+ start:676 stop:882 length:207 start_codon:yes stop_codon:yes gene_type:complete